MQVKSGSYVLDPVAFPAGDLIKKDQLLGRLAVSPYSGDTDGDGDFDEIHAFGARSFSVWNSETHELVYDSGSDFERITSLDSEFGGLFNANNTSNGLKNSSDNKGPEPEGVTISQIGGRFYAFITLERIGGVMTYDITNPGSPIFVDYDNSRTIDGVGGDLGPEGIIYISSNQSPIGLGLVVVANEISSTISVFVVSNNTACFADFDNSGIYYAATALEGDICRNKDVIVVGGGNSAGKATVFLSARARHVHLLIRRESLVETMSDY